MGRLTAAVALIQIDGGRKENKTILQKLLTIMSGEGVNMKIRGRLYFKKMMTFIVGTTFLELHDKTALQRSPKHLK